MMKYESRIAVTRQYQQETSSSFFRKRMQHDYTKKVFRWNCSPRSVVNGFSKPPASSEIREPVFS